MKASEAFIVDVKRKKVLYYVFVVTKLLDKGTLAKIRKRWKLFRTKEALLFLRLGCIVLFNLNLKEPTEKTVKCKKLYD